MKTLFKLLSKVKQFNNKLSWHMKSRHQRNNSLIQEKYHNNQYSHHRSFSYTRHQRIGHKYLNHLSPEIFHTEDLTFPVSAEFSRENKRYTKKTEKETFKPLKKQKGKRRSKEPQSDSLKKKKEKGEIRSKKSRQKVERGSKGLSREVPKHKKSNNWGKQEQGNDIKHRKSGQIKRDIFQKTNKNGNVEKDKKVKRVNIDEFVGLDWQDVLHKYGNYLSVSQIAQIRQYKWIYFLGKIKQRKFKLLKPIDCEDAPIKTDRGLGSDKDPIDYSGSITQNQDRQGNCPKLESQNDFYKYELGDHIAYRYEIIESINQGSFGQVLKVFDHKTKQYLALKIAKKSQQLVKQTFMEISILTQIRQKDKTNLSGVVRIKDFTIFRNHICMVFQLLDGNLYQLLVANHYNGLREDIVRIFAVQILNSLSFLQKQRIIHCDIKPENIVMKNWGKSGIKLVDFGSSCFQGKQVYEYLQSRYYRAPEIIFKKSYSQPIDMWSFGCLIAQLKLGQPIFAGSSNLEHLLYIINSIGLPNEIDGPYSREFLKSPELNELKQKKYLSEYKQISKSEQNIKDHPFFSKCKYIKTCMKTLKERMTAIDSQDMSLYYFLKRILVWQPEKRLTPQEALQDPWITRGLPNQIKELYTIFNSIEYSKRTQKNSKDSKNSTNKSNPKKSKQKSKIKEHSGERKVKQGVKFYSYNSRLYGNGSMHF